jgi:hypothetical protein
MLELVVFEFWRKKKKENRKHEIVPTSEREYFISVLFSWPWENLRNAAKAANVACTRASVGPWWYNFFQIVLVYLFIIVIILFN